MSNVCFRLHRQFRRLSHAGCPCSVEFLLAAGPAEALRPLGAVASGGETARVMLALKAAPASVLAASDNEGEGRLSNVHS